MTSRFQDMLTGGHLNSLGRTIEVVETVLAHPQRIVELFDCYGSSDEVVRLRVSNALRRVQAERPDLIVPLLDRLLDEIAKLDQPSAQWTLPKLFAEAEAEMDDRQRAAALKIIKRNLGNYDDWIVLNNSIEYLSRLAGSDDTLRQWRVPQLERLSRDPRKSAAKRAQKALELHGGAQNA